MSFMPRRNPMARTTAETSSGAAAGKTRDMRPRIDIPVRDPDPETEARQTLFNRGRFLARQEAWEDLGREICDSDSKRRLTPGLSPVALWLAEGARSDAVSAAKQAIAKNEPRAARAAVASLELVMDDVPGCPALSFAVAMAHVDLAQAWRGKAPLRSLLPARRDAWEHHMKAAASLADRYDPFQYDSTLWALARCRVLEVDPHAKQRVSDDYEDLIDTDPQSVQHLIWLGRDLVPSRFGSHEMLEVQARRTAARTSDIWGMGGYTLTYMGAIEQDQAAMLRIDPELFCEGLHDILDRQPNQNLANRLAAFCGLTLSGKNVPGSSRARLASCFGWIVEDHLRELHPAIWAHAALPGGMADKQEDSDLIRRGMARALSALAEQYASRISAGERLIFTPKGLKFQRAA